MNLFGLTKEQYDLLNVLAVEPLKKANCKVWVFGSRVTNKFQKFSDIDLLYEFSGDLELSFIFKIKSALVESNLPVKVDIVNIKDLADSYKSGILEKRVQV